MTRPRHPGRTAAQEPCAWKRYRAGDVIEQFDAPVAAVDRSGQGRMTRSQYLNHGDLFCYLPPFPAKAPTDA